MGEAKQLMTAEVAHMNMTEQSRIEKAARAQSANLDWLLLIVEVFVIAVFPILESIVIQNMDKLKTAGLFWPILIPLGLIHLVLGLIVIKTTKTIAQYYFDHKDVCDERDLSKKRLDSLNEEIKQNDYTRSAINLALNALIVFMLESKPKPSLSNDEIKDGLKKVLSPIIKLREHTFNFVRDSKYNFAVYLYSETEGKLKVFYRETDSRLNTQNRSWAPGAGHVGFCYANKDSLISDDVVASPELSQSMTESDKKNYRSMASTPIFYGVEKNKDIDRVRGVFIVTSSVPGQFNKRVHGRFLKMISNILSVFFEVADVKLIEGGRYV